ncbi:hypothetical protein FSP39_021758 [Pinctada imbricata]|uniref:SOCS box domain-containing protein n=1 Tax=Pinctada imbricata TaxID=66713 RepID=A0AA88XXX5_PINIB|nr:hypothetical protein FSP39_021758 [Pinctada imbricata]
MDFTESYQDTCSTVGLAAREGDLGLMQDLIWHGRPCDVRDNRGWTPLHEAAFRGHSGCLDLLLRQEGTDVTWKSHDGNTALILAARGGHMECVRTLVEHDADVNATTKEDFSPLWEAVQAESLDCVRCLLRRGAEINHQVYTGYTPLHLAAEKGYGAILAYLIGHGARLDIEADYKLTPIFLASQYGHSGCLKVMLRMARERGQLSLVNKTTRDNATPLLIAAQQGYEDCLTLLLTAGADPNIPIEEYNAVAAHFAIYKDHPRCLQILLPVTTKESLFDNVDPSMHPLLLSLQLENTTCLEILIAAGMNAKERLPLDFDEVGNDQDQELFCRTLGYSSKASILCHIGYSWPLKGVEFLLRAGLPCNPEDSNEVPPLLVSIARGASELFHLLLHYGANPNIYHSKIHGNLVALLSLKSDLRCQNIVTDPQTGMDRSLYARFLSNMIISGGEVSSCLQPRSGANVLFNGDFVNNFDIYDVLKECTASNNIFPVLTFMYLFSCNVSLEEDLIKMALKPEWINFFFKLAESSHTLAHTCRRTLVLSLVKSRQYKHDLLQELPIPALLKDFILFMDTELGDKLSEMIADSFYFYHMRQPIKREVTFTSEEAEHS